MWCIMSKQFHSKLSYREIVVHKQSLDELIEENKDYIAWLVQIQCKSAVKMTELDKKFKKGYKDAT